MLRVLIAGGGVAGLEALLALRDLAGDRVELTLLSPETDFVYRPMAVAEPFGRGRADRHPLADIAADVRAELIHGALAQVDAPNHVAITGTGQRLSYDALLVAVGAGSEPAFRHVLTWTPGDRRRAVRRPVARPRRGLPQAGGVRRAAGGGVGAARLRAGADDRLAGLGDGSRRRAGDALHPRGRAARAVRHAGNRGGAPRPRGGGRAGRDRRVRGRGPADPGRLVLHPGERTLDAERVVALPRAVGPGLPGLPANARGFIPTDLHGRVPDVDAVWAAGDAIAFPVKQGGLASQQADAAAESIAAHAGAELEPRPYRPVLRGMMLTGRGKAWMRHQPAGGGEGTAVRRALWWPPTKIAGRYLSPYLAARHGTDAVGEGPQPDGQPVELDLEREVPATADALRQASLRGEAERARLAERRAEARREAQASRPAR